MEKCKRMKRQLCMSKKWIHSWQWKSSKIRQQFSSLGKLCDEHGCSYEWINGQRTTTHFKTGFGYNATRETSNQSWFLVYQRVLLRVYDRQLITFHMFLKFIHFNTRDIFNCVKRKCGEASSWRSVLIRSAGMVARLRENLVDDRVPEHRDSHASSSHGSSLEPTSARSVELGKQCLHSLFLKTEIARSARGRKSEGPRAGDAIVEPHFVQKILVTWSQQMTKFSVKVVNLETITDMQSWYRI